MHIYSLIGNLFTPLLVGPQRASSSSSSRPTRLVATVRINTVPWLSSQRSVGGAGQRRRARRRVLLVCYDTTEVAISMAAPRRRDY